MRRFVPILLIALVLQGCIQTLAIRTMGGIMDYGFEAFNEETDLKLAEDALGSNLKLIEALIKGDPENERLLFMASQGYSAYALAFAEDESQERAKVFYIRGRDYGLRLLKLNSAMRTAFDGDTGELQRALQSLSKDDVPAVFWTAFGWAGYANLARTDVEALAALSKISAMMEFVLQQDPGYYYAGAHLFFGSVAGSIPAVLGGKPERAKEQFEKALSLNGGKFLMTHVYYAKTYAVQAQDKQLFDSLLTVVDEASLDILPEAKLPNAVAKRKAELLRESMDDLFIE
ncbi:MAG: TRAP transporter TatT component family protein [Ignavibacteriae bacterium]|nr:TRAP transporter TatT component family protein [Ignavibacteriota bacterium]